MSAKFPECLASLAASTEIFSCDSWSFNPVDAGFASSLRWTSVPFRSLQSSSDAEAPLILKHDMHHRVLGGRCLHMKAANWHFLGGKHTTGFWGWEQAMTACNSAWPP